MRPLAGFVVLFALASPALAQPGEERRYFYAWLAACRDDGYCSATAYQNPSPANGTAADYILRIGRHAEEIYWEISFTTVATMGDAAAPFNVAVDGSAESFEGPGEVVPYGAMNDFFLLGPKAQALMDRMMPGARVDVGFEDETGVARTAGFSLKGLTAALIWIDERQGRLGSERVAEAPPVGLEPIGARGPLRLGELGYEDLPAELIDLHFSIPDTCDPFDMLSSNPSAYDLGADGILYFVPCTEGAYNYLNAVYLADRWGYSQQRFAAYEAGGWISVDSVWNPSFDPSTMTLETYNLGRSMGDCGIRARYAWEGRRFVLTKVAAKPDCDATGEPGEFPVVFERPVPAAD